MYFTEVISDEILRYKRRFKFCLIGSITFNFFGQSYLVIFYVNHFIIYIFAYSNNLPLLLSFICPVFVTSWKKYIYKKCSIMKLYNNNNNQLHKVRFSVNSQSENLVEIGWTVVDGQEVVFLNVWLQSLHRGGLVDI